MVSGAYRTWIEHGLATSSSLAQEEQSSGCGDTLGTVEMNAEMFSLHGSFYA
jgi:hypothetical protein